MARFVLNGKVALVTGAARGIGFETARLLHQRGAFVVVCDLDQGAIERAAGQIGDRALGVAADATDRKAMAAAVQQAVQTYGGLDVVVANAGVGPPGQTMKGMDDDVFERTLEIDLLGVVRTVGPALDEVARRGGQVVVISSVYAFATGALVSPYAIAKAGVEAMGRALRVELAPHGAGATVAHFGFVDTVMVQEGFDGDEEAAARLDSLPAFVSRRLTPAQAATALVNGIERRAPRVIAPGWWKVPYYTRGLFGPLMDLFLRRDPSTQDAVRAGDVPDPEAHHTTPAG